MFFFFLLLWCCCTRLVSIWRSLFFSQSTMVQCFVPKCYHRSDDQDRPCKGFKHFPKEKNLLRKWIKLVRWVTDWKMTEFIYQLLYSEYHIIAYINVSNTCVDYSCINYSVYFESIQAITVRNTKPVRFTDHDPSVSTFY